MGRQLTFFDGIIAEPETLLTKITDELSGLHPIKGGYCLRSVFADTSNKTYVLHAKHGAQFIEPPRILAKTKMSKRRDQHNNILSWRAAV